MIETIRSAVPGQWVTSVLLKKQKLGCYFEVVKIYRLHLLRTCLCSWDCTNQYIHLSPSLDYHSHMCTPCMIRIGVSISVDAKGPVVTTSSSRFTFFIFASNVLRCVSAHSLSSCYTIALKQLNLLILAFLVLCSQLVRQEQTPLHKIQQAPILTMIFLMKRLWYVALLRWVLISE